MKRITAIQCACAVLALVAGGLVACVDPEETTSGDEPEAEDAFDAIPSEFTAPLEKPAPSIHGTMSVSDGTLIVNQNLVTQIPSYSGSGWWFCGQAAMASAINLLRGQVTSEKVTQLEWYHQQLLKTKIAEFPYTYPNHFQASMDALRKITDDHPDFVVPDKFWNTDRQKAREAMKSALDSGYVVVALGEITINTKKYGHFMTVYKIEHIPEAVNGGWVYYADPYTGHPKKEAFSTFLDGVGADKSYSFIKIKKQ